MNNSKKKIKKNNLKSIEKKLTEQEKKELEKKTKDNTSHHIDNLSVKI